MNTHKIIEFTDLNFEKKISIVNNYILIDFWAEWCNPCKLLTPILEEISLEYSKNLIVGKLNIETNTEIPLRYSIRSIPTLLLFYNSEIIATKIGALSKIELLNFLNKNMK
ncbi:thioredoxin [Buchnera aphidicola]|uniref:Thioredoxin n=1 Tax=Buchnera aphidicola subsp. Tuberolachnus salignus TaxID=98804 RepID=A0A170PCB7_BUCTT|nr:thioredoxin [Buchnera aphidicola]CUR53359.1 Thioredoxin-1 [Buchnera aphidicola (Tuberolachnus salignus)]